MNDQNILDTEMSLNTHETLIEIVDWWEKKRLSYTILVIATEVILMTLYWEGTKNFGIQNAIFQSFLYTLAANFFYTLGWIVEIFINYYFRRLRTNSNFRLILFVIGTLFSIILTYNMYGWTLIMHQVFGN